MAEILQKLVLNTNQSINQSIIHIPKVKTIAYGGEQPGFLIHIKKETFVRDHPMTTHVLFRFNQVSHC